MYVMPGTAPDLAPRLTRDAAQRLAANWWVPLLNGIVLIVAGVLIFSIDWTIRDLATFIGALFIFEGLTRALTAGIERRVQEAKVLTGLLAADAGVALIV